MKNKGKIIELALIAAYSVGGILKAEDGAYNIFTDPLAKNKRDAHRKSLEAFVAKNPTIDGITTKDFVDFLSQLSGLEGSYNPRAGEDMKYSGLYGLEGGREYNIDKQHRMAFKHLANIFKNNMTKYDYDEGISQGFTPAQILAKYWNQGNRVTKYLHKGVDDTDGLNTKISEYGNNLTSKVDYEKYLPEAITDDFVIIEDIKTMPDAISRARNEAMNYTDRENHILKLNIDRAKQAGKTFNPNKVQVGDTLWLENIIDRELPYKNF